MYLFKFEFSMWQHILPHQLKVVSDFNFVIILSIDHNIHNRLVENGYLDTRV